MHAHTSSTKWNHWILNNGEHKKLEGKKLLRGMVRENLVKAHDICVSDFEIIRKANSKAIAS